MGFAVAEGWASRELQKAEAESEQPIKALFDVDDPLAILKFSYPDEADLIEGLRRYNKRDLIEQAVLEHREAKRLFRELEALRGS